MDQVHLNSVEQPIHVLGLAAVPAKQTVFSQQVQVT
jgi:hypothetical protein